MKFAIWLLVVAAIFSLLALFAGELLPGHLKQNSFVKVLELSDPFRSWWFRLMLGVLVLSLFSCIIERTPSYLSQTFKRKFKFDPERYSNSGYCCPDSENENSISEVMEKLGFKTRRQTKGDDISFHGSRGSWTRIGPLGTHLGMLILIIGSLVTSITGFSTRISGSPGRIITDPNWDFSLRIDDFKLKYHPLGINQWVEVPDGNRGQVNQLFEDSVDVKFPGHVGHEMITRYSRESVSNDFFVMSNGRKSPYTGNIKSYITTASLIEEEKVVKTKLIEVNSPLRFRGFRFYQSSFEFSSSGSKVDTIIVKYIIDQAEFQVPLVVGDKQSKLPGSNYSIIADKFLTDFRLDKDMQPFSVSKELNNPALLVRIFEGEKLFGEQWIFTRDIGTMGHDHTNMHFTIARFGGVHALPGSFVTILDVNMTPWSWIIWLGFVLVTFGLILTYSANYQQVWGLAKKNDNGSYTLFVLGSSFGGSIQFVENLENAVLNAGYKRIKSFRNSII